MVNSERNEMMTTGKDPKYESFYYDLGGIIHQSVYIPGNAPEPQDIQTDNIRVIEKLKFCDERLFHYNAGVIIGLKNGHAVLDGGLKIKLHGKTQRFTCYPIYVNKYDVIEDPEEEINGQNIFSFIRELQKTNPKLRLDGTMTSGYCESEEMKALITELNTRNSYLDVWAHK